ncbi:MAG TPA: NCS2 family permease, partial [Elusimicrobiota bacterium]|nr:NCS2 family permease [Elusimicrobiota bacterium]
MRHFFRFEERATNFRTEVVAGITTFLTMAYIIFVNPGILSAAGISFPAAVTATALGSCLICVTMGLVTNRPLALAPGMGVNAVVAFSVIGINQANVPWQVGMSVIFLEGLVILGLVLLGLRGAVMDAIPLNLKRAIGIGIGLFITLIGLNQGGLIRPAPITLVALGDFSQKYVWVTLIGLGAILIFMALRVKGALLWGILSATGAALCLRVTRPPTQIVGPLDFQTFFAPFQRVGGRMALGDVFTGLLLLTVFSIMMTDFFDTMGTVVAVGEQGGFVDKRGKVSGMKKILTVDSLAALVGGLFGSSSITTYVESAAGVAVGGRTGLTAIVTGLLFGAAAFFAPVIQMVGGGYRIPNADQYRLFVNTGFQTPADAIPPAGAGDFFVYPITAGALIIVGFLLMKTISQIDWNEFEEAFPAFLTIVGIPLTYNISYG